IALRRYQDRGRRGSQERWWRTLSAARYSHSQKRGGLSAAVGNVRDAAEPHHNLLTGAESEARVRAIDGRIECRGYHVEDRLARVALFECAGDALALQRFIHRDADGEVPRKAFDNGGNRLGAKYEHARPFEILREIHSFGCRRQAIRRYAAELAGLERHSPAAVDIACHREPPVYEGNFRFGIEGFDAKGRPKDSSRRRGCFDEETGLLGCDVEVRAALEASLAVDRRLVVDRHVAQTRIRHEAYGRPVFHRHDTHFVCTRRYNLEAVSTFEHVAF